MRTALLLLNGDACPSRTLRALARRADLILAADGGARAAQKAGLEPDIVLGDMDSLPRPLPRWKKTAYSCDFDENLSDFEKALRYLLAAGISLAWVAGADGGRADHARFNYALVERYAPRLEILLVGRGFARVLAPGRHVFDDVFGATVSLLPVGRSARVRARGLKYPLEKSLLKQSSRGLSNKARSPSVAIQVIAGRLWVFFSRP